MEIRMQRGIVLLLLLILLALSVYGEIANQTRRQAVKSDAEFYRFPVTDQSDAISPIDARRETIDLTETSFNNYYDCVSNVAEWVNADNAVILTEPEWTLLDGMLIETETGKNGVSPVFINFTCNISDKVPGFLGALIVVRLVRGEEELTTRQVNLQRSADYYHDMTIALSYTDVPEPGEHEYRIEYKLVGSSYRALAIERNLQVLEIFESRSSR